MLATPVSQAPRIASRAVMPLPSPSMKTDRPGKRRAIYDLAESRVKMNPPFARRRGIFGREIGRFSIPDGSFAEPREELQWRSADPPVLSNPATSDPDEMASPCDAARAGSGAQCAPGRSLAGRTAHRAVF